MKRICLVGIPGVGKSTLLNAVLPQLANIDYLVGSQILGRLVGDDFPHFDRYPDSKKQYFRQKAIEYIKLLQEKNKKHILIDGHTTLLNKFSNVVEKVFTRDDCLFFTDLIFYHAPCEIVLSRRKKDNKKKRSLDIRMIELENSEEREESMRIAREFKMGWYELEEKPDMEATSLENSFLQLIQLIFDNKGVHENDPND